MPPLTEDDILHSLREREDDWIPVLQMIRDIRLLNDGRWGEVFQDKNGRPDTEEPMIANLFRDTIEDGGHLFAEGIFQDRVDFAEEEDRSDAERREQALAAYNAEDEFTDKLEFVGQDILAAGYTAILTWPSFRKPITKRFPAHRLIAPEMVLPEPGWSPRRRADNVMLHYTRPARELATQFPDEIAEFNEELYADRARGTIDLAQWTASAAPKNMEVVDLMASDFITRAVVHRDGLDDKNGKAKILMSVPNPTGLCPVTIIPRAAWSHYPLSQIGDTRGVARTRNRYFKLILDAFIQLVYGPTVTYQIKKLSPTEWLALSPDARAQRVGPDSMAFQAFQILDLMEKEERTGKVAPLSREGELDLNKATAAFLTRAQGKLNSAIQSSHRQYTIHKRYANEVALAQDESEWCNASKEITGKHRGRRFKMTYVPAEVIQGDHSNRVTVSSSGIDRPTQHVLDTQKVERGLMSEDDFLERDPDVDDAPAAMLRIVNAHLRKSALAVIDEIADPAIRFQVIGIIATGMRERKTIDEVIEELKPILAPPPAPAAIPGPETPALPPGMGPPGIPGAEQGVVEQAPPALSDVRRRLLETRR